MEKSTIKNIFEELCQDIITQLNVNKTEPSKDMIIDFLQQASYDISKIDISQPEMLHTVKDSLEHHLEDLVQLSIDNYSQTNQSFEDLAKQQSKILDEFEIKTINIDNITNKFSQIQEQMLQEVNQANDTINHLKKQVIILKNSSELDYLTKTYNRRALSRDLEKICETKHTKIDDAYLIIIDIDDFKQVNDTYGHIVGDKILIFLANTVKKVLRDVDKVYRYGGEEFIIILNRTNENQCKYVSNRIISTIRNSKLIYKNLNLAITVSIGVTNITDYDVMETVIDRADTALYKAKANGKDQIVVEQNNEY